MKKVNLEFQSQSRMTSFWGTGASGATTLSLEYAQQVASAGRKTLLIDHDLLDPSLMVYLAIDNYPSGLQAGFRLASQQRLDPTTIDELIIESEDTSNLSFMAGLPVLGRFYSFDPDSLAELLENLMSWFDELVIDLGMLFSESINSQIFSLQKEIIASSDYVYGVFRADPEGISKLFWLPLSGDLIANDYRPGTLGAGGKKKLKSVIAEITGLNLVGVVEEDDQLVQAITKAVAVGQISRKSPISQLLRGLIENRPDSSG